MENKEIYFEQLCASSDPIKTYILHLIDKSSLSIKANITSINKHSKIFSLYNHGFLIIDRDIIEHQTKLEDAKEQHSIRFKVNNPSKKITLFFDSIPKATIITDSFTNKSGSQIYSIYGNEYIKHNSISSYYHLENMFNNLQGNENAHKYKLS